MVVFGGSEVRINAFVPVPQQQKDAAPLCKHEATAAAALWQVTGSTIRCAAINTPTTAGVMVAPAFAGDIAAMSAIRSASSSAAKSVPIESSNNLFEAAILIAAHSRQGAMRIHQLNAVVKAVMA